MSLLALLSGCSSVSIPDTKVCAVAGVLNAGADCAHTLKPDTESMTFDQFLDFLEPQSEKVGPDGSKIPGHGAALCQSSEDWNKQKTALEVACKKLGNLCSYEMKAAISNVSGNIQNLQTQTTSKKDQINDENRKHSKTGRQLKGRGQSPDGPRGRGVQPGQARRSLRA